MKKVKLLSLLLLFYLFASQNLFAAKLVEVKVIDQDYLMIYFKDGDVTFVNDNQQLLRYGTALNIANATAVANWSLKSTDDTNYGTAGKTPSNAYRKSKISGSAQGAWIGNDFTYEYTMEHIIYLKLPFSLVQGKNYTLTINSNTNTDITSNAFAFNIFTTRSEAIHVNLAGYTSSGAKPADLYFWMGDGGARDYTSFHGKKVYIYNVSTLQSQEVGTVNFWKASENENPYNLTGSDVWNVDFTNFTQSGTYRLVVEGVGSSQDFQIANDVYKDPFAIAVKGFFYMRLGQNNNANLNPPPRTPLFIPNVSPSNTIVYITSMTPFHPDWATHNGDPWDSHAFFSKYVKPGSPQNPNAWGGHSDAADWDRHLGHISIIYDLLLPYIVSKGALSDDNVGIPESGNGVPDVIDEARYEVDFWLRLRHGKGYSHGISGPDDKTNLLYQADNTALAAWANAANAAILAESYRIAGNTTLMNQYRDSSVVAYNYANGLADKQLDVEQDAGYAQFRGRDLKMMAAAYLFNLTGNTAYEDVINAESIITSSTSAFATEHSNQIWASVAYLTTNRPVRYPTLLNNMKASMIHEAKVKEANLTLSRPSRRAHNSEHKFYFQTMQNVHHAIIAHAITTNQADKDFFRDAFIMEASWGLGRNPINTIQMTTATTSLASKRSIENMYTSGKHDGVSGLHPGHTPYLNTQNWNCGMAMGCPTLITNQSYPANSYWPQAELYFNTRHFYAHSEYTPQQTMRGKMALYGYLHVLGGQTITPPTAYTLSVTATNGSVSKNPNKATYSSGESVILTATPNSGYTFTGWSGSATGTISPLTITMNENKSITANFTQTSTPPACTNYQAENGYTGSGVVVATNQPGYSGTGFVDFGGQGTYAEWTVNVASAGSYTFKFRHANGSTGNRQAELRVNGTAQGNIAFASTGSWTTWSVVESTVTLNAGNNIIRLTANTNAGGTNLDSYELCDSYTLNVTSANGSVTRSPNKISYTSGETVTLTATSNSGYSFSGWSGDATGTTNSITIIMNANKSVTANFTQNIITGYVVREYWNDVQGITVADIPVSTTPTGTSNITSLAGPAEMGDNYATRVRGYIIAPTSGSYTFWITGDDNVEFWLSTNDQASGKARIAYHTAYSSSTEWNKYPTQMSSARTLTAGQKYYFEVYHKEGNGGDNWSVGWAKPGQATIQPIEVIPGAQLSPFTSGARMGASEEEFSAASFYMYPMPASNILNIRVKNFSGDKTVKILNTNGATMIERALGSKNESAIEVSSLSKGLYIISVSSDRKVLYKKLLINE